MQIHPVQGRPGNRVLQRRIASLLVAVSTGFLGGTAAPAQEAGASALVDKLVKKGILTTKEGEEVRADFASDAAATSASKIKISPGVTEMKLFGDLRMRYQYDNTDFQATTPNVGTSLPIFTANTTGDTANGSYYQTKAGTFAKLPSSAIASSGAITFPADAKAGNTTVYKKINTAQVSPTGFQRSRERFRLRLDAEVKLGENWFAGVELATSPLAASANQTFGASVNGAGGAFGKYNIFINRVYLGWHNDWLTVRAGKFPNSFYTTDLVWDPDINPEGVSESIAFHKLFGAGAAGPAGYAKDGKSAPPLASESPWELTLNAAQYIFQDNNEGGVKLATTPSYLDAAGNAIPATGAAVYGNDSDSKTDAWIFNTQLVASYKFGGVKATIAPGWLFENGASVSTATGNIFFNDSALVSGGTRNLNILLLPGDVSFNVAGIKTKLYWDAAYNVNGRKREENTYLMTNFDGGIKGGVKLTNHQNEDDFAYLAGILIGENKKAGDFSLLANWRQTGISSVDPNLHDDDFALGFMNTRGVKASASYNFTDFAVASVSWFSAWNIRKNLIGGEATTDNAIANANQVNVLFVDFTIKF